MIIVWSFDSQLQINCQQIYCFQEISFHFWMNRYIFRYKSMKSEKKNKQNRLTKRVCHRSLPIDRYNQYQSNRERVSGKISNQRFVNSCLANSPSFSKCLYIHSYTLLITLSVLNECLLVHNFQNNCSIECHW